MLFSLLLLGTFKESSEIIAPFNVDVTSVVDSYPEWRQYREKFLNYSRSYPIGWPRMHCDRIGKSRKIDIDRLLPGDIDVVAALGDSLTEGQAINAKTLLDVLRAYPGNNFVTGADYSLSNQATLYNIFKKFSQDLESFNVAVSGSTSSMLPEQAQTLVEKLMTTYGEGLESKMIFINIFIGHNDLCKVCENETLYGAESYYLNLLEAIKTIKSNVPNAFINIMSSFDVNLLRRLHQYSPFCEAYHRLACPCLFKSDVTELESQKTEQDAVIRKIVEEFEATPTFDIIYNPVANTDRLPEAGNTPNVAFFALDCFHFSLEGHDLMAKETWRSLFISEKKPINFYKIDPGYYVCPSEKCPYLRTRGNAKNCTFDSNLVTPVLVEKVLQSTETQISRPNISWLFGAIGFMVGGTLMVIIRIGRKNDSLDEHLPLLINSKEDLYEPLF